MPRSMTQTRPSAPYFFSIASMIVCDRLRIVRVAGEDLVAQRKAVLGHHQADADLRPVGAAVARVTALGQRTARHLALEVGAGHVVQQQVALQLEQFAEPLAEMLFQRLLVRQELIERLVEPVGVDLLRRHAQEIRPAPCGDTRCRRCAVRWTARRSGRSSGSRPSCAQDTSSRPGSISSSKNSSSPSIRHSPQASQTSPKSRGRSRRMLLSLTSSGSSSRGSSRRGGSKSDSCGRRAACPRRDANPAWPSRLCSLAAQLAQIGDHPLPRSFGRAIRFDQRPIGVRLAVLPSFEASEKHERSFTRGESSPTMIAHSQHKSTK